MSNPNREALTEKLRGFLSRKIKTRALPITEADLSTILCLYEARQYFSNPQAVIDWVSEITQEFKLVSTKDGWNLPPAIAKSEDDIKKFMPKFRLPTYIQGHIPRAGRGGPAPDSDGMIPGSGDDGRHPAGEI